jgi:hypothetical protein
MVNERLSCAEPDRDRAAARDTLNLDSALLPLKGGQGALQRFPDEPSLPVSDSHRGPRRSRALNCIVRLVRWMRGGRLAGGATFAGEPAFASPLGKQEAAAIPRASSAEAPFSWCAAFGAKADTSRASSLGLGHSNSRLSALGTASADPSGD